jgi:uncharacterized radical SAM superfamily protein
MAADSSRRFAEASQKIVKKGMKALVLSGGKTKANLRIIWALIKSLTLYSDLDQFFAPCPVFLSFYQVLLDVT